MIVPKKGLLNKKKQELHKKYKKIFNSVLTTDIYCDSIATIILYPVLSVSKKIKKRKVTNMKKLLSALLALTLVFSLSVMAAAEDTTAAPTTAAPTTCCPDPVDTFEELLALIQSDEFKADLKAATDKLAEIAKDTEKIAPFVDDLLVKIEEKTGVSVADLKTKLGESEIFNAFAKIYMPAIPTTAAPVVTTTVKATEVPKTGSAVGGIAIFATLSIAAAAAFVCTKKK